MDATDTTAGPDSPVLNLKQAAKYVQRTPKAMYGLRTRRVGPDSFRRQGRIYYYIAVLDAWLAAGAATDSRSNPALDPTRHAAEPRRMSARRPLNA
ncbi:hypothetical protein [Streptomyces sp. CB03911]|uniref:hypothetical protein n=1 Tax=Streptomyces sp. CB03911 TaxID=1804758 RepID=UPI00093A5904|nr:hypothetical protein [Streptomyces sp. CB03911]OKI22235.1 hypothetical protein A6A07_34745 [Streptomyces sp. CB03911]